MPFFLECGALIFLEPGCLRNASASLSLMKVVVQFVPSTDSCKHTEMMEGVFFFNLVQIALSNSEGESVRKITYLLKTYPLSSMANLT